MRPRSRLGLVLGFVLACGASKTGDDAPARCTTACDCPVAGHACHEGVCKSGTIAVFCCTQCPPEAPPAQTCEHADGSVSTCGAARR